MMADQMAEGHAWLRRTFGVQPRVGWQIDPFGHTWASAAVHSQAGFEALVINRIHHRIKTGWRNARRLEFWWQRPHAAMMEPSAGGNRSRRSGGLLTHVLHTHYSSPKGFDFEPLVRAQLADAGYRRLQQ